MMAEQTLLCMTEDCTEEATVYCSVCKQLFCDSHNEVHTGFLKVASTSHQVVTIQEYKAGNGDNSPYCRKHDKSQIVVACERCYHPMCLKCFDDTTITRECVAQKQGGHLTRTIDQIAEKIRETLNDMLSELRVSEMTTADQMKKRRQLYDDQMEGSRNDLDKLDKKIQELQQVLEDFSSSTRERIEASMKERKTLMDRLEKEFADHQKACEQLHERASDFVKLNKEAIVKNQQNITEEIQMQISTKVEEDGSHLRNPFFMEVVDKPIYIPLTLRESIPPPSGLRYTNSILTPSNRLSKCVHYTDDGILLHSGTYNVVGLNFTPQTNDQNGFTYSICQHDCTLYVLRFKNKEYRVDMVDLWKRSVQAAGINFQSKFIQHMAINDKYIIVSYISIPCVRVYATKNSAHLFNIKHDSISSRPWGVGFLDKTLVVTDHAKQQVTNMTICATPDVKWTCTGITSPAGLRVVNNPEIILVASYNTRQLYVLSHQGIKLSTLSVPQCSAAIVDIAVYGNNVAVADDTNKIKIYEMEQVGL